MIGKSGCGEEGLKQGDYHIVGGGFLHQVEPVIYAVFRFRCL